MDDTPKNKSGRRIQRTLLIWLALFAVIVLSIPIVTLAKHYEPIKNLYWGRIIVTGVAGASVPICLWMLWKFMRWSCRCWDNLRSALIGAAIFATLVALLYAEEDWRGKRAWENYKHEWEAKGEKFDWQAFVPPPVPNGQNFFTAPIFTNLLDGKIVMNPWHSDGSPNLHGEKFGYLGGVGKAFLTDLKQLQESYRNPTNASLAKEFPVAPEPQTPAKDVLYALSKFDSAVEDLRQASQRPYANLLIPYEEGLSASASALLPDLAALKRCTQLLQLRASAELANGQGAKALDDVKLLLYLNNSLRTSPFLISHLVRIAIVAIGLQPIWEGLAEHKWSDEQLAALEAELGKLDFLTDYEFAMRGERAFAIAAIEDQRRTRESISGFVTPRGNGSLLTTNNLTFMPSAYFYQNELARARMQQQWILPLVDTNSRIVSPAALQRAENSVQAERKHYSPYKVQALMSFPVIGRAVEKFAQIQSSVDLARVACALERYRLAHGEYPETLDALAPQFIEKIPHDIINGQPLHYRRPDDGRFILYSVGWNETEDGGTVVFLKGGYAVDREKGDWVWQYPVN